MLIARCHEGATCCSTPGLTRNSKPHSSRRLNSWRNKPIILHRLQFPGSRLCPHTTPATQPTASYWNRRTAGGWFKGPPDSRISIHLFILDLTPKRCIATFSWVAVCKFTNLPLFNPQLHPNPPCYPLENLPWSLTVVKFRVCFTGPNHLWYLREFYALRPALAFVFGLNGFCISYDTFCIALSRWVRLSSPSFYFFSTPLLSHWGHLSFADYSENPHAMALRILASWVIRCYF